MATSPCARGPAGVRRGPELQGDGHDMGVGSPQLSSPQRLLPAARLPGDISASPVPCPLPPAGVAPGIA